MLSFDESEVEAFLAQEEEALLREEAEEAYYQEEYRASQAARPPCWECCDEDGTNAVLKVIRIVRFAGSELEAWACPRCGFCEL